MVMTQWTVVQTPKQIQVAHCENAMLSPDLGNDIVNILVILVTVWSTVIPFDSKMCGAQGLLFTFCICRHLK